MSNQLHFYTKYSKEKIKISDKPFASGGEGAIYAIASPRSYSHLVAKMYYPEKRTPEREAKMLYLMQNPPITFQKDQAPSIGWVQDLVYKDKRFIGILLIKIEGKKLTKLTLSKLPRRADKAWQRFAFQQADALKLRLRTCFNLAVVIHQIHESGQYVLVDLKPDNILMQPNGLLAVVDMDSVEVVKDGVPIFSAPVATPEYTPPEHYAGPRTVIEESWDYFSLGVIFYQLLFGLHPFAASCKPPYDNLVSIHNKIEQDLYVHHSQKQAFFKVIPPPHQQFYKIPKKIQELFQYCFEHGAKEPLSRPSPADWCNTLADLLKLPFKKIPKINIPPSNLYFLPKDLLKDFSFSLPELPANHSILNVNAADLAPTPQNLQKGLLVEELKEAYKKHLHQHRERLLQTALAGIILGILFFTFPVFFALALLLLSILAPQLFLTKFQNSIDNIGKAILAQSTYQLLKIKEEDSLEEVKLEPTTQLVQSLLSQKKHLLQEEISQLTSPQKSNQEALDFIQQYLEKRADVEKQIDVLNHWLTIAEPEIIATRKTELEAYKIATEGFLQQLKQDPTYQAYEFRSFSNLRVKIQQKINALKGSLAICEKPLKQLELEFEKKLDQLKNTDRLPSLAAYRNNQEALAAEELKVFETKNKLVYEHKEAYWDFIQKKKTLDHKRHQQKQKNQQQLDKSLKQIRKDLGLSSQTELEHYMDLLNNQQEAAQLDFAVEAVQKQFDQFLQQIQGLNIDASFSNEITRLLKQPLPRVSYDNPLKAQNIKALADLQQNMTDTWEINQTALQEFNKGLQKLTASPEMRQNPVELSYWAKARKTELSNILFNLNQYSKLQEHFYGDPIIFRLKNKLTSYEEEASLAKQKIQLIEEDYLAQLERLEEANKDVIENQNRLEDLKTKQEALILEKEKDLKNAIEKKVKAYKKTLEKQQKNAIELAKIDHEKEVKLVQKQIANQQLLLKSKLNKTEYIGEQLNEDYAVFEQSIDKIRADAELVYRSKRLHVDFLHEKIAEIQKEHPKAVQLIKENVIYYQELRVRILEYKDNLNELNQLQKDKIRLDTLSEWQKAYDSRIYIKDLLLNKVEQFEHYEQKKQ